jgi:hypothetical protein
MGLDVVVRYVEHNRDQACFCEPCCGLRGQLTTLLEREIHPVARGGTMLKFLSQRNGHPLVFLGLSEENVRLMGLGKPIVVQLSHLGLPDTDLCIYTGRDETDLAGQLRVVGLPVPELPEPEPGQTIFGLQEVVPAENILSCISQIIVNISSEAWNRGEAENDALWRALDEINRLAQAALGQTFDSPDGETNGRG